MRIASYLTGGSRGKTLAVMKEEKKRAAMDLMAIIVERSGRGMTWRIGAHEPNAFIGFLMCRQRIQQISARRLDGQMSWFPHRKRAGIGAAVTGLSEWAGMAVSE